VCVAGRVDCATGTFRDGTSEKHGEDVVVDGVRLGLVEGEENQHTVVVEVGVVEQGEEPEIDPAGSKVDGGWALRTLGQGRGLLIGPISVGVATPVIRKVMVICLLLVFCEEVGVPR
jgi:hypothetical protein